MDEPFGAIDPINREEIQNEFLRVQDKLKKTIAFVTHDVREAIKMGDRIAIFKKGKLVQYDTPEIILTQPVNQYIADFVGSDRTLKVLGLLKASTAMEKVYDNVVQGKDNTREALNKIQSSTSTSLIVLEEDKPVGYVNEKSLKGVDAEVKKVAEPFSMIIEEEQSLNDILSHMLVSKTSYLPVVDNNGNISGTIRYRDIQKSIRDIYAKNDEL
jgi:osmoprotectant transport system ATP-binding protein